MQKYYIIIEYLNMFSTLQLRLVIFIVYFLLHLIFLLSQAKT
jgi:hypothetical protein